VVDIGSRIGFTACVAGRKIKNDGVLVAVEAAPKAKPVIEHNLEINGIKGYVESAAYHPNKENVYFSSIYGFLGSNSIHNTTVKKGFKLSTLSLSEICEKYNLGKFGLIVDIEGDEELLLEEIELISRKCEIIIIELHGSGKKIQDELRERGYTKLEGEGKGHKVCTYENKSIM